MINKLHDWQFADYSHIINGFSAGNYHASILYPSVAELDEKSISSLVTQYLLCLNKNENLPCGECISCKLFIQNNHPDVFVLKLNEEEKASSIKVEQVRDMIEFTARTSHNGGNKVVVINDIAEITVNINSTNSLLKILEEPPANCFFVINAKDTSKIIPTILSRAAKIKLNKPPREYVLDKLQKITNDAEFWLNYFDGEMVLNLPFSNEELEVLLNALCLPSIDNVYSVLKTIDNKAKYVKLLEFILKWLQDCLTYVATNKMHYFSDYAVKVSSILNKLDKDKLFALQQELIFLIEWENHPVNHKLQLENMFFKYQQLYV